MTACLELSEDRLKTSMIDRVSYASDASHYLYTPEAVIIAKDAEDVAAILRTAGERSIPVTLRSGGTSLCGQGSGSGWLVDTRRNFRGIEVLDGGKRVRVRPGATVREVNAVLAPWGYRLGPDPASEAACTIGGVIANNSSGMLCGTEYNTYRTLESMILVLASGTMIDTSAPDANAQLREREPELCETLLRLRRRILDNPESMRIIERHFALKNTMGYGINSFVDFDTPVDILSHLIIGSEGTLAFVAEAVFRTVPISRLTTTTVAVFPDLYAATRSLPELIATGAATLELMDATSLKVGQTLPGVPRAITGFPVEQQAALLIEYNAEDTDELQRITEAGNGALAGMELFSPATLSTNAEDRQAAWQFRKGLYASVAGARPAGTTAMLEDIAVPVEHLADTCASLQELFERYGYENSVIFGHAKDGNIHFMLTDRFEGEEALGRYTNFNDLMVDLVLDVHGNLKAEHGTGRAMAPYVRQQYGDELYEVMVALKAACDPLGQLNPGVILDEDPRGHLRNMKLTEPVEEEVNRCVECGYCEPVCPSKDLTLTPRQRIVVRRAQARALANGQPDIAAELDEQYEYAGIDTCAVDGMCLTACPVGINTADLVRRLRRENASPLQSLAWKGAAKAWTAVSRGGAGALSLADKVPGAARLATEAGRKILGADTVPAYDSGLPAGGPARADLAGIVGDPSGEVLGIYLPACVGAMFGPEEDSPGATDAFLALLKRAGVALEVPEGVESLCCATPWSSKGFAAGYEAMKAKVRRAVLGSGLPVISDAASCTEGLAKLLEGTNARAVDAVSFTAEHLLDRLTITGNLGTLVLHPTCSSKQMGIDAQLRAIAAAISDDVRIPVSWGCCGFAGDRGMLHPELTASATAREAAEVRAIGAEYHASLNRTCEIGMTRATGAVYHHILEYLERVTREPSTHTSHTHQG
ncbi:MAG: FAD-binding and (Fe-S)-binding domain-containing protein [Flaviflexus sp.]|nr:FAD-binding and (Fe-S)-binding domain-containing protein [Flaviflexus sp.]